MSSSPAFQLHDRVALRAAFLRSIGDYSHATASRRGVVVGIDSKPLNGQGLRLLQVDWGSHTAGVLSCNLIHADRIHLEPA